MSSGKGLNDSIFAKPPTNHGIGASKHNPANGLTFGSTPTVAPGQHPITFGLAPHTSKTSKHEAPTAPPPKGPARARKDLRLTPVFLIQDYSGLLNFSIDTLLSEETENGMVFSIEALAAGIAQKCSAEAIRHYVNAFARAEVESELRGLVKGLHPVLFYAAERNCVDIIRLLLDYGCEANAKDAEGLPVLAFAIMRSNWTVLNPAEAVKMLLAFGADPHAIPDDMWFNYLEPPSTAPLSKAGEKPGKAVTWCTTLHRKILASTLNLSVRYFLHKASQLQVTKKRGVQVAQAHGCVALLKVPYMIIGQPYATKHVANCVFSHISMDIKRPLVMTFAGLSGHGKTELAKQMGELLQVPITVVDCAQMRSDIGLFGSRTGYVGNEKGSQLNNHLATCSAQRSVVFLDEFDKTDKEIHNSLLLVLDSGEYHDRRTNKPVDASKTIWIMATNLGDEKITRFYHDHLEGARVEERDKTDHRTLVAELKALFARQFGPPMAGRMKNIAPFYPFDPDEQAVVVHKFFMELVEQVRKPIDLAVSVKKYPGHVHLAIKNDGKLCAHLAKEAYIQELGARSLTCAIDDIRRDFFISFVDTDELVEERMNEGSLMKYKVQLQAVPGAGAGMSEVGLAKDGYASFYRGQGNAVDAVDEVDEEEEEADDEAANSDGRMDGLNGRLAKMMNGDAKNGCD